ncbi:MAG: hypothetical protein BCS36_08000 [Desulfovibrio sp. MES5]|nr:MAG: hypothetical protein BCS36_08000 [Desulfovibrio sp. MES5]
MAKALSLVLGREDIRNQYLKKTKQGLSFAMWVLCPVVGMGLFFFCCFGRLRGGEVQSCGLAL